MVHYTITSSTYPLTWSHRGRKSALSSTIAYKSHGRHQINSLYGYKIQAETWYTVRAYRTHVDLILTCQPNTVSMRELDDT
jgi:hypothetical protein